jgi:hypothetical protein
MNDTGKLKVSIPFGDDDERGFVPNQDLQLRLRDLLRVPPVEMLSRQGESFAILVGDRDSRVVIRDTGVLRELVADLKKQDVAKAEKARRAADAKQPAQTIPQLDDTEAIRTVVEEALRPYENALGEIGARLKALEDSSLSGRQVTQPSSTPVPASPSRDEGGLEIPFSVSISALMALAFLILGHFLHNYVVGGLLSLVVPVFALAARKEWLIPRRPFFQGWAVLEDLQELIDRYGGGV